MMNFKTLSDQELLNATKAAAKKEQGYSIIVLKHLLEIDNRRLYADLGYSSLYAYITEHLFYSKAEAYLRIKAIKLMKTTHKAAKALEKGSLSLTNASELYSQIKKNEDSTGKKLSLKIKEDLIDKIENLSTREAEKIIQQELAGTPFQPLPKTYTITVDEELYHKLQEMKILKGIKSEQDIIKKIIKDLEEKNISEKKGKLKNDDTEANARPNEKEIERKEMKKPSRYISPKLKVELLRAANHRCEWVDPKTGKRCEGDRNLQVEHCQPFAHGGENKKENLKILCRAHNIRACIKAFGLDKISPYINQVGRPTSREEGGRQIHGGSKLPV